MAGLSKKNNQVDRHLYVAGGIAHPPHIEIYKSFLDFVGKALIE
jgi:hypothetical protein